jgi:hypothetical protein
MNKYPTLFDTYDALLQADVEALESQLKFAKRKQRSKGATGALYDLYVERLKRAIKTKKAQEN